MACNRTRIVLTSVDNSGIRLSWMFDCLDRRDFESLFNFALNDWICGNLGERGGLDIGIFSIRETPSVCEGEEEQYLTSDAQMLTHDRCNSVTGALNKIKHGSHSSSITSIDLS